MRVLIVVTHLLGTGHLARALTLARAFHAAGHTVTVASGGLPATQLDQADVPLLQLPPVRSDGVNFTVLHDAAGNPASADLLQARGAALAERLRTDPPDVLITELFPFGRRILRAEFTALLETAKSLPRRPLVCASVRDILAPPSKPAKAAMADDMVARFYDAVLVHADRDVTPLDLSWPVSDALAPKLHYTGFVAPPAPLPHPDGLGAGEIIVSAGGGDVGAEVFACARAAAEQDPGRVWRLLVGGASAAGRAEAMRADARTTLIVEAARPDFRQMLHHAAASVSLCGYNTALDILQTGCRAVFVPFDAGNEVEQGIRAQALARLPGIAVVRSADLTPTRLLAALRAVRAAPARPPMHEGFDGADRTVRIVSALAQARP